MFQCRTYSNTDFSLNDHTHMFYCKKLIFLSDFPILDCQNKLILNFDSKFHNSYLMKWLLINFTRYDTIQQQLYLTYFSF